MQPRTTFLVTLTAALAAAVGCGGEEREGKTVSAPSDAETSYLDDPCSRPSGARRKRFHVTDEGFRPRKTVVKSGVPVTFINCGDKPHTVTKVAGLGEDRDSGTLEPREKFQFTFTTLGTVKFADRHNPDATMTVKVAGLPGQPQN